MFFFDKEFEVGERVFYADALSVTEKFIVCVYPHLGTVLISSEPPGSGAPAYYHGNKDVYRLKAAAQKAREQIRNNLKNQIGGNYGKGKV